jgi:anti-sigma-K factor RskA
VIDAAHKRHQDDLYAYLLGALDEQECGPLERHLAGCNECRQEVERLRPIVDSLGDAVEQLPPPARLKESVMRIVEREAAEHRDAPSSDRSRLADRLGRMRGAWRRAPVAAALAVGAIGGVGVATLLTSDDVTTVPVQADRGTLPEATGTLDLVDDGKHGAILRLTGMPSPPPDRTYQAWIQRDGKILPQPTFGVTVDGNGAAALPADLTGASAVLVTREPLSGSQVPSEQPIVRASLPDG